MARAYTGAFGVRVPWGPGASYAGQWPQAGGLAARLAMTSPYLEWQRRRRNPPPRPYGYGSRMTPQYLAYLAQQYPETWGQGGLGGGRPQWRPGSMPAGLGPASDWLEQQRQQLTGSALPGEAYAWGLMRPQWNRPLPPWQGPGSPGYKRWGMSQRPGGMPQW